MVSQVQAGPCLCLTHEGNLSPVLGEPEQREGNDLSVLVPRAISPFSQVPSSKGIHELGSSAQALQHTLDESASLLTMFWRAALPSSPSPALSDSTVSGSLLHCFCPKCHSASSVPKC